MPVAVFRVILAVYKITFAIIEGNLKIVVS